MKLSKIFSRFLICTMLVVTTAHTAEAIKSGPCEIKKMEKNKILSLSNIFSDKMDLRFALLNGSVHQPSLKCRWLEIGGLKLIEVRYYYRISGNQGDAVEHYLEVLRLGQDAVYMVYDIGLAMCPSLRICLKEETDMPMEPFVRQDRQGNTVVVITWKGNQDPPEIFQYSSLLDKFIVQEGFKLTEAEEEAQRNKLDPDAIWYEKEYQKRKKRALGQ